VLHVLTFSSFLFEGKLEISEDWRTHSPMAYALEEEEAKKTKERDK
jgi:hypothetical protein